MDTNDTENYKLYIVDGINSSDSFDFSVIENICDTDVFLKRRNNSPGILRKGTPFTMSSSISASDLFGNVGGENMKARAMIIKLCDVNLDAGQPEVVQRGSPWYEKVCSCYLSGHGKAHT